MLMPGAKGHSYKCLYTSVPGLKRTLVFVSLKPLVFIRMELHITYIVMEDFGQIAQP